MSPTTIYITIVYAIQLTITQWVGLLSPSFPCGQSPFIQWMQFSDVSISSEVFFKMFHVYHSFCELCPRIHYLAGLEGVNNDLHLYMLLA